MWPYWLVFLLPAGLALAAARRTVPAARRLAPRQPGAGWLLAAVALTLFIGYRVEVGGDWQVYLHYLDEARALSLAETLVRQDPGYWLLNRLSVDLDAGIVGVNLACAAIFATGLASFCRAQPRPWLALAVAVPYLVIVVGMGYTRQGVAMGFAMLAFVAAMRGRMARYVGWILLATTFHRSAFALLLLAPLLGRTLRPLPVLATALAAALAWWLLVEGSVEHVLAAYVLDDYSAGGAGPRMLLALAPVAVLAAGWRRLAIGAPERRLLAVLSLYTLVLGVLWLVFEDLVIVDRFALYSLPLQLAAYAHLPSLAAGHRAGAALIAAGVVAAYGAVLFVWLNFATHADQWLPYRFYPLEAGAV